MSNARLKENPDDHRARLHRAQAIFDEGVNSPLRYQFNVLTELDYIIARSPEMDDNFWLGLYILRGKYKIYYENSFERGLDDFMLAMWYDSRLVEETLVQTIVHFTYYSGRNPAISQQIEAVIKEFVLYKSETFRYINRNHYYFLFQEIVKLGKLYLENGQVERAQEIADMLCGLIPHDKLINVPTVDQYLEAWELQCLIAIHNRDDGTFMRNFYLYVGAPYGQNHSYNQELLNYYNFSVEYKDYYYYMCKAIMDSQLSYQDMGMTDFKRRIFRSVMWHLGEAEKFESQSDFYMTYFIKAINEFEVVGNTELAYNYIEKAILYNPYDAYAQMYKLHIMQMDHNYGGKITVFNDEVNAALEDNKRYCSQYMHNMIAEQPFKEIPTSILVKLRSYSSMITTD
ncbi:MAG: hypothetical protein R2809_09915 [Flavobacteriales bacterium]